MSKLVKRDAEVCQAGGLEGLFESPAREVADDQFSALRGCEKEVVRLAVDHQKFEFLEEECGYRHRAPLMVLRSVEI
ncbi:hypothetical protein ACIQOW_01220 [Kitasatospora sp. NPDC091335]|uniref:hypothetical protein n=1 Tax=Kitasatospora sp. NPDC091335 TaxID=3364085 RepID=UPI0037F9F45D